MEKGKANALPSAAISGKAYLRQREKKKKERKSTMGRRRRTPEGGGRILYELGEKGILYEEKMMRKRGGKL